MEFEKALIIGSTGGIGSAIYANLEKRLGAANLTGVSRTGDGLDVRREGSVESVLNRLDGEYDLIFIATGALQIEGQAPEKALKQITEKSMRDQFEVNTLGPALLLKHSVRFLPKDRPSAIGVLSARVGSIGDNGIGGWYGYRTAKAAVNQVVHTAAIELSRSHKQAVCAALHPGTVATPFTRDFVSPDKATPPDEAAQNLLNVLESLTPEQSGGFYDYSGAEIPW